MDEIEENEIEGRVPRELRTPITEAFSALNVACSSWVEIIEDLMADNPEIDYGEFVNPESYFFIKIFGEAWDDTDTNGDKLVNEIKPENALLEVMLIIVAYAVQATKAEKGDKHNEAWAYAADANYWAGIMRDTLAEKKHGTKSAVELAKRRHSKNYALIEDAREYWHEHIDQNLSASKAAEELLKVIPLSHKTLAEVVSKAKKTQS